MGSCGPARPSARRQALQRCQQGGSPGLPAEGFLLLCPPTTLHPTHRLCLLCTRRYTTEANRGFSFSLFYSLMNVAAFCQGAAGNGQQGGRLQTVGQLRQWERGRVGRAHSLARATPRSVAMSLCPCHHPSLSTGMLLDVFRIRLRHGFSIPSLPPHRSVPREPGCGAAVPVLAADGPCPALSSSKAALPPLVERPLARSAPASAPACPARQQRARRLHHTT